MTNQIANRTCQLDNMVCQIINLVCHIAKLTDQIGNVTHPHAIGEAIAHTAPTMRPKPDGGSDRILFDIRTTGSLSRGGRCRLGWAQGGD